jgi:serine/threonine protein kinase
MTSKCHQFTFETEVENYRKLTGVPGIPTLKAVVRKDGLIQGLLRSYIEGLDLWSTVENGELRDEALLLDITYRIIHIASNLEQCKFYHEDLKCSNIVRRHTDGELYFIDFGGGLTEGMYREERVFSTSYNGPDASDALFTLGRTLWELWAAESPWKGAPLDRLENQIARNIIRDCEEGNVESIIHLSERYCPRHSALFR